MAVNQYGDKLILLSDADHPKGKTGIIVEKPASEKDDRWGKIESSSVFLSFFSFQNYPWLRHDVEIRSYMTRSTYIAGNLPVIGRFLE